MKQSVKLAYYYDYTEEIIIRKTVSKEVKKSNLQNTVIRLGCEPRGGARANVLAAISLSRLVRSHLTLALSRASLRSHLTLALSRASLRSLLEKESLSAGPAADYGAC